MLSTAISCGLAGITGIPVRVEVDVANGLPQFNIVGLTDRAIQEARQRVRAAVRNSGLTFPDTRVTVNLAPAEVQKEGTGFDLAIAVGLVACREPIAIPSDIAFIGELSLDGKASPISGILPMIRSLHRYGISRVVVANGNADEAVLPGAIQVYPVASLGEAVAWLRGDKTILPYMSKTHQSPPASGGITDLSAVSGQQMAKRALEIAAAGQHNLLLLGPPGAGKTLLAKTLPSILPDLDDEESLEVAEIYSAAGKTSPGRLVSSRPPFRAPHHSISRAGLVGGGSGLARPGEISLAHKGVLFLDEICEFPQPLLEALRQPLEEKTVAITRARGAVDLPADFTLVAAANPCRCGYDGDPRGCTCEPAVKDRYLAKLSGPIRDRIDLTVSVPRQPYATIFQAAPSADGSQVVRARVARARLIRSQRAARRGPQVPTGGRLLRYLQMLPEAAKLLAHAGEQLQLSARAFSRVARVARTIADLGDSEGVACDHVAEALCYRSQ